MARANRTTQFLPFEPAIVAVKNLRRKAPVDGEDQFLSSNGRGSKRLRLNTRHGFVVTLQAQEYHSRSVKESQVCPQWMLEAPRASLRLTSALDDRHAECQQSAALTEQ